MPAYPTATTAAIMIGKKASQERPSTATEAITVPDVATIGARKSRRISTIGRFTASSEAGQPERDREHLEELALRERVIEAEQGDRPRRHHEGVRELQAEEDRRVAAAELAVEPCERLIHGSAAHCPTARRLPPESACRRPPGRTPCRSCCRRAGTRPARPRRRRGSPCRIRGPLQRHCPCPDRR